MPLWASVPGAARIARTRARPSAIAFHAWRRAVTPSCLTLRAIGCFDVRDGRGEKGVGFSELLAVAEIAVEIELPRRQHEVADGRRGLHATLLGQLLHV